jgi:asparagine synthase (glutamine-hydrolysing)
MHRDRRARLSIRDKKKVESITVCGIAGIAKTGYNAVVDAATIDRMCQPIVHRGPDDQGICTNGPVGLGMRRLSIIDLSGGRQPIHNEDKTAWIVFNGEIYNFPELRLELEQKEHKFYTNTDTEVIVHLYEEYGAGCVRKLRGMFAFAIFDERNRRLLLARDRLGIKPLHYAVSGDQFLFGSEMKSILAVAPELKEINHQALLQYLYWSYIPDPLTAFKNIYKLPPGHVLEWVDGQIQTKQYWDLPRYGTHESSSEEECLEELESLLAEAVRIRLIADVPLGALLSGGVDSSTVVALMARASCRPVKTFTIGFAKQDFNEAGHARLVAQRFGTEHHELVVESGISETLHILSQSLEEPFGDSSMIPTYHVSRLARQHVTVALSGDGGDELFAGYDRYGINARRQIFEKVPAAARTAYRKGLFPLIPRSAYGRRFAYNISLPWGDRYLDSFAFVPSFERQNKLLSDDFCRLVAAERCSNPLETFREYLNGGPPDDPLSQLLYLDTKTYLPGDILTKVDRMSMAASLEARVPILDHLFVERVTAFPSQWKLRGTSQKYILKKLAERVGVPREVIYRPKQGFAMPLAHWMRDGLGRELPRLLLEPRTLQRGYFDRAGVQTLCNEHLTGRRDHSNGLWTLLMLELWHRNFLESAQPDECLRAPVTMKG